MLSKIKAGIKTLAVLAFLLASAFILAAGTAIVIIGIIVYTTYSYFISKDKKEGGD